MSEVLPVRPQDWPEESLRPARVLLGFAPKPFTPRRFRQLAWMANRMNYPPPPGCICWTAENLRRAMLVVFSPLKAGFAKGKVHV